MQEQQLKTTRPIRWHEICRAALIIGLIDDYSKGQCLKLAKIIDKRVRAGKAIREARGIYRGFVSKGIEPTKPT